MGPLEVSVQQVTCHFTPHFTFLQNVSLRRVTRDQEIAREETCVPGARLRLRPVGADAAHRHRPEPGGPGRAAWRLPARRRRLGRGPELPQSRAPQTAHYPGDAAASVSRWARGGGDPCAVEGGPPEGAAG